MRKVTVNASKKYDILIGGGLLEQAGELIKQAAGGSCAAIITDSNVAPLYMQTLSSSNQAEQNRCYRSSRRRSYRRYGRFRGICIP